MFIFKYLFYVSGIIALITCLFQLFFIVIEVPPISRLHAILDVIMMSYASFSIARLANFGVHLLCMIYCLFTGYLSELGSCLALQLKAYKRKATRIKRHALECELRHFMAEHERLHALGQQLDSHFISGLILVAFLTNTLANIVLLNQLLSERMSPSERAFLLIIILLQMLLSLTGARLLIAISEALYRCDGLLYGAQASLGARGRKGHLSSGHLTSTKLHLMSFFEITCTKKPFTFTVGSLSDITMRILFEVGLLNMGFPCLYSPPFCSSF